MEWNHLLDGFPRWGIYGGIYVGSASTLMRRYTTTTIATTIATTAGLKGALKGLEGDKLWV